MAVTRLLAERLALVTGGGSGIGRAVCQAFSREGAKVIVADCNLSSAQETVKLLQSVKESYHQAFMVDVGSSKSVNILMQDILRICSKPPTIAVTCAGIVRANFLHDMVEEEFDSVINVNLKGTYLILQAVSKLMIEHQIVGGSLITIASIVGKVGYLEQCNYSASKAGVDGLMKSVAKELARHGIRCNSVLPGLIETPMSEGVPEKVKDMLKKSIPLERFGEPTEVADVCTFLASDKSSYITGSRIEVTGGLFM